MELQASLRGVPLVALVPQVPAPGARDPLLHATYATLPAAPCASCAVRRLCLPGPETRGQGVLDSLMIGRRRVRKGQKLYREGDPFHYLQAVRFGSFKSGFLLSDGSEHVNAFYWPGDVMGFDGTADGRHPTTVTALENGEVCAISHARLMEACSASPALRQRVSQLMGTHLVREHRSAGLVARRQAEDRVAAFLLELAGWMRDRGYSQREFHIRMSRADIGSYLGTSLETVSRALSQFAREGLIRVRSRHIELVDPEGLRAAHAERREEAAR